MILHNSMWMWGCALVNTGTSLLGTINYAGSYEYFIPADVNMLMEPSVSGYNCIKRTFLAGFPGNFQLHKPKHLCVLVVTVLKNRLLYQVYNTPAASGIKQSWHLVYEEVVPVDMQTAPAANISLGLSALQLKGVLYDR